MQLLSFGILYESEVLHLQLEPKQKQKVIKDLLLSNQIDMALLRIDQMIRNPYDQKEKDNLVKLYTYISRNRQGITNQVILKDQEIQRTGAIESNLDCTPPTRHI